MADAHPCGKLSLAKNLRASLTELRCTHCNRAFWWETAELVTAVPPKKMTRAQKKKEEPPPPYYMTAECELDRLERVAREEAARAAAVDEADVATS